MYPVFSRKLALLVFSMLALGLLLGGYAKVNAEETAGVKVAEKEGVGQFLTDGNGMTLYTFAVDEPGTSSCTAECLDKWPPFYVDPAAVVEGCEAGDFSTITREDGSEQTAYKGMPLYYFFNDNNPGDTNGHAVKDVWFVATP